MEWNVDFKVSTIVMVATFECELNVSGICDFHCEIDGGATGIIDTSGHVPAGGHGIEFDVTDDTGMYNTIRKQITVTRTLNEITGTNMIAGYIQLPGGGGGRYSTGIIQRFIRDTGKVNVSWTPGCVSDMPPCPRLGIVFIDYGL